MRYYNKILANHLTFKQAADIMIKDIYFATRPDWDGVHFLDKNKQYKILLKSGEVIELTVNELNKIHSRDKNDWMIVQLTNRGKKILSEKGLI